MIARHLPSVFPARPFRPYQRSIRLCWLAVSALSLASHSFAEPLTIENPIMSVRFEVLDSNGTFTVTEKASGVPVISRGTLMPGQSPRPTARIDAINDPLFGMGRRIAVPFSDGSASLELYPSLPFLLIRSELKNNDPDSKDIGSSIPAGFTINLGKPSEQLRTIGTAGLSTPVKNPGSYLFLTCADQETRHGIVAGWLTQDRGSGVFFSPVRDDKVSFTARIDYGHLLIPPGKSAKLETLAIGVFPDARIGLENFADAVNRTYQIKLRKPEAVYCTWYSDGKDHALAGIEATTLELSKFIANDLKPFGLGVIQIDDQWQDGRRFEGPRRGFERHLADGPYPNGIAPVAKALSDDGLDTGLWWMPFSRNHQAEDFKDREDWFVNRINGLPYENKWGGTSLDLTRPEVIKHITDIAKSYRQWGVKYFKMDGFSTGAACNSIYINDGYVNDHFGDNKPFHDPNVTNIEAFRSGIRALREAAGDDVFFSACCVSQNMRSFFAAGLVDAMRIGPDFNHDGEGIRTGPLRGSRLYFMNGRIWWNDPDPTKVRPFDGPNDKDGTRKEQLPLDQARLTTSWVSLAGQFFLISDWLPYLSKERIDVLKRTMAHHDGCARPVDYFDNALANTWLISDTKTRARRDVIGVFNFYPEPLKVNHTLARIGLDPAKTYHAFDFWADTLLPDIKSHFASELKPNSCKVISVRADEGHPVLLSTSRHVTQGILEVSSEQWFDGELRGISSVIANDSYELRVYVPDGWELATATAIQDGTAQEKLNATTRTEGRLLRVRVTPTATGNVRWSIRFKR